MSSAVLDLPDEIQIIYAELIWGGMYKSLGEDYNDIVNSPLNLQLPDNKNDFIKIYPQNKQMFAYKDVSIYCNSCNITNYISNYPRGLYKIKNITILPSSTHSDNDYRWTLAVIYKNSKLPFRKLNLYVGGYVIDNTSNISIPISKFETPSTGQTKSKIFMSTLNGNNLKEGAQVLFGTNKDKLVNLLDYMDNETYDIISIDASKELTNSQNSAIIKLSTTKKIYIPTVIGIQIDMNAPIVTISQDVKSKSVDNIRSINYSLSVKNDGSVAANNVKLNILPNKNIQYNKNSLTINSNPSLNNINEVLNLNTITPGNSSIIKFSGNMLNPGSISKSSPNTATLNYDFTTSVGTFHGSNKIHIKNIKATNIFPPLVPNYEKATYKNTPTSGKILGVSSTSTITNYTLNTPPTNGFANINSDGRWQYTPKVNFIGQDEFSVSVIDSSGNSSISTISILIKNMFANQDPINCCPCNIVYPHQLCKYKINTNPYYCY
ncbi:repeat domain protein [Clostridium botulinum BKT015925]|nr:repeat domain protein [Clostridium botulinum BKT015925]